MRRSTLILLILGLFAAGFVLVFLLAGGTGQKPASAQIRINEVIAANKGAISDGDGHTPGFVEISNLTGDPVDISGFGLTNKNDEILWAFPENTVIEPFGYVVAYCSGDVELGALHTSFTLKKKDKLRLTAATGAEIDSVQLLEVENNRSFGLDEYGDWLECLPSPGYPNTDEGAAAYREHLQETMDDNGVRVNEFMASNVTTLKGSGGDYPDWIELYNTTDQDVDISGCGLSDDTSRPMKWVFPADAVVKAKSTLLIYCTGRDGWDEGQLHCTFRLNSYSGSVVFSAKNGGIIDSYTYGQQSADASMAREIDGTGAFSYASEPTPGFNNTSEGRAAYNSTLSWAVGDVHISEALSDNAGVLTVNGTDPDWIELTAASTINLKGYALTDNPKNPAKWGFPDITLQTGEHLVILATGNDVKDVSAKYLETNFKLSALGETIFLFDPSGNLIDKLTVASAGINMSTGRTNGELRYYDTPTPGEKNGEGYIGVTDKPMFSLTQGVYGNSIDLEISAEPGASIYYTMNAAPPTKESTLYTSPINIDKNTVIRAIAIKEGYYSRAVNTGTYLFTSDEVNHSLPIAALVMDPNDLWNEQTGIYVNGPDYDPDEVNPFATANYYKKGDEWERLASFSVFGDDGFEAFTQDIYARIAGSFGRRHPQKGFNLIARDSAGKDRMEYAFFDNREYTSYKALVLRAGAQDQPNSKIRDELSAGLLEGTDVNILYQAYKPYVLYLNGEYWGVYFLKEKRNRFFVAQHEGLENNTDLDLIKSEKQVYHGSSSEWAELMKYIASHDMSKRESYDYLCEQVDIDSFTDYMATEIYVANSDYWNIQYYKIKGGKWKWIYYDFCWGWNQADHNTVTLRRQSDKPCSDLFNALLKNAGWKDKFVRRIAELSKTVYAPERVNALVDELYAKVQPEIERERAKFNQSTWRGQPTEAQSRSSYSTFESHIKRIRDFSQNRVKYLKENLEHELGLSDAYIKEVFG